jgi:hypothetical protein
LVSADRPPVALLSAPSPAVTPPIVPVTPAEEGKPQQVQVPSVPPAAKMTAQGPETPAVKARAHTKCRELREKPTHRTFANDRYSWRLGCSRHRP